MKQKIIISNIESIIPKHQHVHEPYEYLKYEITPRNNDNKCYVALYEIPPLKANYPYHFHMNNTEVFYIISGEGMLISPDGEIEIKKGE